MEITARTKPFRYWLIDDVIPESTRTRILNDIPPEEWTGWVRYHNELEKKWTTQLKDSLAHELNSWTWLAFLENLTGIPDLLSDQSQYGAGLHMSAPGDLLGCHLDFSIQPETGLERRLNLIVYLNDCQGGQTQLYDSDARNVVGEVEPKSGRILVWECSEVSYHGTAQVMGDSPRYTAAFYYYTKPRPGCSPRTRALFCPRR